MVAPEPRIKIPNASFLTTFEPAAKILQPLATWNVVSKQVEGFDVRIAFTNNADVSGAANGRPDANQNRDQANMNDQRTGQPELGSDDIAALEKLSSAYQAVGRELSKVIVGQHEVIEQLMIAIFARGHCLLEGVPGLAKTLMVSTLARTMNLDFARIQFTPDLMPSDIVGLSLIHI